MLIHLYTFKPLLSHTAMSVLEFIIGIETEGFWKGKAGSNLPGNDVKAQSFAEALVPCYNNIRKDLLRADFLHGSHPGHYQGSDDKCKWTIALDDAIGELDLNSSGLDGRTYSVILCRVTMFIDLISIQIPLNLSLRG